VDRALAKGEYTVTFCWGNAAAGNQVGQITNPTCKSATVIAAPGATAQVSTGG
jgi:hypothetical protein